METPLAVPAMQQGAWRHWLRTENLGLSLTLGYLFLTGLGMFHRALVFLKFRINVFDYAEPSDFLLAALRDPLVILASIAPIPIVSFYFRWSYWVHKRTKQTQMTSIVPVSNVARIRIDRRKALPASASTTVPPPKRQ